MDTTTTKRISTRTIASILALLAGSAFAQVGPASAQPAADPQVLAIEQALLNQHYDPGPVDGVLDADTRYGITAFEKVNGMARTGEPSPEVIAAIGSAPATPVPLVPGGGSTRVEIDLDRQVLFLYESDALLKILPVATGNLKRFCSGGWCRRAVTPGGAFRVSKQVKGWQKGPLGSLYNPAYFNGGIAIHGSKSVPAQPASHGCVRIPMSAAEWLPSRIPPGTPVYVAGSAFGGAPAPLTA